MNERTCHAFAEELVAYLDHEQPASERARLEAHLGTCLACRRELAQLAKVGDWLRALPRLEPGPDLPTEMWRRLANEPRPGLPGRRPRPALWAFPALAAAAGAAFALYSVLGGGSSPAGPARRPLPQGRGVAAVARMEPAPGTSALPGNEVRVVGDTQLRLEDVPPEVIEHPELFLRLPVVRRLDKLEHFEEVRHQGQPEHPEGEPGRAAG